MEIHEEKRVLKPQKKKDANTSEKNPQIIGPIRIKKQQNPTLRPKKKKDPPVKPYKKLDEDLKKRKEVATFGELKKALRDVDSGTLQRGMDRIFSQSKKIRPGFSSSWVAPHPPYGAKAVANYDIDGSTVTLFFVPEELETLYHVKPVEYDIPISHVKLIHMARAHLTDRFPKNIQIDNPEQAREYISNMGNRLIYQLAKRHAINLGKNRSEEIATVKKLSRILAKYTAGFGIVEFFLKDDYVQDVYIDASPAENRVYIKLGGLNEPQVSEKCTTNISVGTRDAESLLSRFRYESGRPFSEAMPVLETDLASYGARATAIGKPLSPDGIAIALRRHSPEPWTLLKLIYNGTISSLAAGLISFLIDGKSTILVVGSRGAGKTSLLGAIMLEFPQNQRILTIEDTLELPVTRMQDIGYKVQSLSVQSTLGGKAEMSADEALRISLRLGESAIVMGEVRGDEARTLYEAMRAGTAGSSVLGTFHADSAKSVYQRVVHDMHISPKSFLATDIIIVSGIARPGGSQREMRRVMQIAEVRKHENESNMFQDLLLYDEVGDKLLETDAFNYRSERIGSIAASWGLSLEECMDNIRTRARYRQIIVDYAKRYNKPQLLAADWVSKSNSAFWNLVEKQREGANIDHEALMERWSAWFTRSVGYV